MRLGSETALARQQALTATADTAALAGSGRGAVLTALADMRRALGSGADCLSERGVRNAGTGVGTHGSPRKGAAKEKGDRRKARAAVKRIEFLASWCAEFVEEQRLQELSEEIWGDYEEVRWSAALFSSRFC